MIGLKCNARICRRPEKLGSSRGAEISTVLYSPVCVPLSVPASPRHTQAVEALRDSLSTLPVGSLICCTKASDYFYSMCVAADVVSSSFP
jgi:hypothetical protein